MSWQDDLQPASWRKVPFYVETSDGTFGRNTAVHAYPFREKRQVWVEDLGLMPAIIRITGFLVGDDVRQQQLDFFKVMQMPGNGTLVHPVYGVQNGSIVGGCRYAVRKDRGRYAEISFEFIASAADSPYPAAQPDTKTDVQTAIPATQSAAAGAYNRNTGSGSAAP